MGFSTSAAAAIMLIAFLVAAGVLFPAVFAASSDTGDAFASQAELTRDQKNTEIGVQPYEADNGLTVTVENEGTTTLSVEDTDLLVNGEFVRPDGTVVITDESELQETDIWSPGTTLELTVTDATLEEHGVQSVERVKVVSETGIADATDETEGT